MAQERIIRKVIAADFEQLLQFRQQYMSDAIGIFRPTREEHRALIAQMSQEFENWLKDDAIHFEALLMDQAVMGLMVYRGSEEKEPVPRGDILRLELAPSLSAADRDATVTHMLTELMKARCGMAVSWVLKDNFRSRFLYEKYGFRMTGQGRVTDYMGTELREIEYVYRLPGRG